MVNSVELICSTVFLFLQKMSIKLRFNLQNNKHIVRVYINFVLKLYIQCNKIKPKSKYFI